MNNYRLDTAGGPVWFTAETAQPKVLMIHGFKRSVGQLRPWGARIEGLGFIHLPGHGGAPEVGEVSVAAWARGIGPMLATFERPPLLIGESLGAMVALCLPAKAVVAVEPLLSTDRLWPLHRTISAARSRGVEIGPEYEALFDRPYDWVLDRISAPTLVIAGSEPLLPERPVWPEPSLLTDEDFAVYARHPLVSACRIAGGHNLLDHNPDGVMQAMAPFLAEHLQP